MARFVGDAVNMMTWAVGCAMSRARVACRPQAPGIWRSSSTTSGRSRRAAAGTSEPSAHRPRTSIPAWRPQRYCQHFKEQRLVVNDQNANHDPTLLGYVEVTRRDSLDVNWRRQRCAAADSFDLGCSLSCHPMRIERI